MLIHPWDAARDEQEWRDWLTGTEAFGVLAVGNTDPRQAPIVVPTHFTLADSELLVHLARANPVWRHVIEAGEVRMVLVGDHAYIPSHWRTRAGGPDEDGVPTSYYTSVQFVCRPTIVRDPHEKAALLTAQLADLQPEGGHAAVTPDSPPYGRMLPGLMGLRLTILRVEAKFKYDDHNPVQHRQQVSARLADRGRPQDRGAAAQQRRRTSAMGEWRPG